MHIFQTFSDVRRVAIRRMSEIRLRLWRREAMIRLKRSALICGSSFSNRICGEAALRSSFSKLAAGASFENEPRHWLIPRRGFS